MRKVRVHKGGHLNLNWESDLKKHARSEMEKLRNSQDNTKMERLAGRRKKKRKNHRWTLVKRRKDDVHVGEEDELEQMGDADDESDGSSGVDKIDSVSNDSSDGMSSKSSVSSLMSDNNSELLKDDAENTNGADVDISSPNMSKKDVVAKLASALLERQKKRDTEDNENLIFKCSENDFQIEDKLPQTENWLSHNSQETPPKNLFFNVRESVQRKRRALSEEILQSELLDLSDDDDDEMVVPVTNSKRGRARWGRGACRKLSQGSTSSVSSENGANEHNERVGRGRGRGRGKMSSLRINVIKDCTLENGVKSGRGRGRPARGRGGRGKKKQN